LADSQGVIPFAVFRQGFDQACARFLEAKWERLPERALIPLFEALNWAVVLDDLIGNGWKQHGQPLRFGWRDCVPEGELMRAVRYARNRVHHHWWRAVRLSHHARHASGLAHDPPYAWVWQPPEKLPPPKTTHPDHPGGLPAYQERLFDKPVRSTVISLQELLDAAQASGGL
jgi:hypothetical protein